MSKSPYVTLIEELAEIDPWTEENINKTIERWAKGYVFRYLALVTQGKDRDYQPIGGVLEFWGKEKSLGRISKVVK